MNEVIQEFVDTLGPKVAGSLKGTAKLIIADHGSVMLDSAGATASDGEADVVLIASEQVFRDIMNGTQNPAMAFMSRKLKVEGSATRALKVSEILIG